LAKNYTPPQLRGFTSTVKGIHDVTTGEFTFADWWFLRPPTKYNLPNNLLKKPDILHYVTIEYL
jgi:hypothetical protein